MNVMNVLVATSPTVSNEKLTKGDSDGADFQSFLLTGERTSETSNNALEEAHSESTLEEMIATIEDDQLQELLRKLLNEEITSLEDFIRHEKQLIQLQNIVKELENSTNFNLSTLENKLIQLIERLEETAGLDSPTYIDDKGVIAFDMIGFTKETESIQNKIVQLISEINRILSSEDGVTLKEKASELLPLLRQWVSLKGQMEEGDIHRITNDELSDKKATIWKQLVNVYEKRSYFTESNMYKSDSAITRNDVVNWLEQAFNRYEGNVEATRVTAPAPTTLNQAIPMSEVQQHTIHVNSLDRVDRVSDEVISKFNNIVRESRFMVNNNVNQLSITLRPDNLGNMIVRFTQVDGDMAVKIIVSSQAAKTMLESNVHQLKHMFLPHQVVIERNEAISDDEFFGKDEHEKQEESLRDEENSEESQEEETPEMDFSDIFQQVSEEDVVDD